MTRRIVAFLLTLMIGVIGGEEVMILLINLLSAQYAIEFWGLFLFVLGVITCLIAGILTQVIKRPNRGITVGFGVGVVVGILIGVLLHQYIWLVIPDISIQSLLLFFVIIFCYVLLGIVAGIVTQVIVPFQPTSPSSTTPGQGDKS